MCLVVVNLSPSVAFSRLSWSCGRGFNWMQPSIATTNRNVCYKIECFVGKCKHGMGICGIATIFMETYVFSVNCMRILASSEVNVLRSGVTDKIRQMAVCGNYDIPVNAVMDEVEEGG